MGRKLGINAFSNSIIKFLPEIREWTRQGMTRTDIATRLNISRRTFYSYVAKYPELRDSLEHGLEDMLDDIEGSVYGSARGMTIREKVIDEHGDIIKEFVKQLAPNQRSAEYVLNNRRPDKWKNDTTSIDISISEKMKDKLSSLSAEQLVALSKLHTGDNSEDK